MITGQPVSESLCWTCRRVSPQAARRCADSTTPFYLAVRVSCRLAWGGLRLPVTVPGGSLRDPASRLLRLRSSARVESSCRGRSGLLAAAASGPVPRPCMGMATGAGWAARHGLHSESSVLPPSRRLGWLRGRLPTPLAPPRARAPNSLSLSLASRAPHWAGPPQSLRGYARPSYALSISTTYHTGLLVV